MCLAVVVLLLWCHPVVMVLVVVGHLVEVVEPCSAGAMYYQAVLNSLPRKKCSYIWKTNVRTGVSQIWKEIIPWSPLFQLLVLDRKLV